MTVGLALALAVVLRGPASAVTLEELRKMTRDAEVGEFGSVRYPVESASAFPQWRDVLAETSDQMAVVRGCLGNPDAHAVCGQRGWRTWIDLVRRARAADGIARLRVVNTFFNRSPYREDLANYGRRERWVAPLTFLKSSGDCEDYAIAKYATLRLAGLPDERLKVVVVRDQIRAIRHAVLTVSRDTEISVLDSLSDGIFADTAYRHYEAEYSMNASGQWTHGSTGKGR